MNEPDTMKWPRRPATVFAPTFPLDADEMRGRVTAGKAADPGTWLPPIGFLAAGMAFPLSSPFIGFAAGATLSFLWLRWWWRRIDPRVRRSVELKMIDESNRDQDERLRARMRFYRLRGDSHLAAVVGCFLSAKGSFEARLAREHSHFSTHEKMELLVDGLCIGVCEELDGVAVLDRRLLESILADDDSVLNDVEGKRRGHLRAIREAYVTLADAVTTLKKSRIPVALPLPSCVAERSVANPMSESLDLRNAIDELREESEISRNVRARLETVGVESLN
jgi:hypothetical protein